MQKFIGFFLFTVLFYNVLIAQKPAGIIITTRSNVKQLVSTTKSKSSPTKVIYNLKPGETLYSEESFINFGAGSEQVEFCTMLNENYYLHGNDKDIGPLIAPPRRLAPLKYSCTVFREDNNTYEYYYVDVSTGKKAGPFEELESWSYLRNTKPNGYFYRKNEKYYVSIFGAATDLGPYESVNLIILTKERTEFVYKKNGAFYMYRNGSNQGPYQDLQLAYSQDANPVYFFKQGDENYFISMNNKIIGPIKSPPQFCYSRADFNPKYYYYEKNDIYDGYYILNDGSKVPGNPPSENTSMVYSVGQGNWIKLEKTELIKAKSQGKKINCSSSGAWSIQTSDGRNFGTANVADEYSSFCFGKDEVNFVAVMPPKTECDVQTGKSKNNSTRSSYYIIGKNGPSAPLEEVNGTVKRSDMGKSKTAHIINDKLYVNNKFTGISNIYDFSFTDPSNNDFWYAISKPTVGDSLILYINGNKVQSIPGSNGFYSFININTNNDYSYLYQYGGTTVYLKISGQKPYGPYESVLLNNGQLVKLDAKKSFGYISNYTTITIDGVNRGEGTALSVNQKTGTYHWISANDKTISINSYKP